MLRRGRFLTGQYDEGLGVKDVTWLTTSGDEMTPEHWGDSNARSLGVLLDGRAQETGFRRLGTDVTLLLLLNSYHDVVNFTLPTAPGGSAWVCLVDTNRVDFDQTPEFEFGHEYAVTGRSLLLFMLRPDGESRDASRSFRHVMAEFRSAAIDRVRVPG